MRTGPAPTRTGGWRTAAPAVLAVAWGGNHFTPLLLLYRQAEGFTPVQVDLLFALYVVGLVPGFLLAGPLSDRHGRARLVGLALVLGVLGSIVLAVGSGSLIVLGVGRFVSGVGVATAMVVGTSWIKELSSAPYDDVAPAVGARRAALTLTAGFGLGAGVSGVLAQWGPLPTVLPYVVQIALSIGAAVVLRRTPETRAETGDRRPLLAGLGVPRAARRRFLLVVLPAAPWVFGAAGIAFAVVPQLLAARTGSDRIAFAALLTVVGLGTGAAVQPFTGRIAARTGGRPLVAGLALAVVGIALAALEAQLLVPALAVLLAAVLGAAYGVCLVAGLVEVQRMADPRELAGITAVYYSLTYVGFVFPVVLAELAAVAPYAVLLACTAAVCLGCLAVVASGSRHPRELAGVAPAPTR